MSAPRTAPTTGPRPGGPRLLALIGTALVVVLATGCAASPPAGAPPEPGTTATAEPTAAPPPIDVTADLEALEREFGARVGVHAVDTADDRSVSHRADERFGYASSIKALAAAEFLHAVPAAERDAVVTWTAAEVAAAGYSPVTSEHDALPLSQLAEAAVRRSDYTALNLILARLGGPGALDDALEQIGDTTTEVVSTEPALNDVEPGSTDDTTTPAAFTADLRQMALGGRLLPEDRALLLDWMSGNATGDALVRAGAPEGWAVADKSGGAGGIRNDVAIVTPPGRAPIVVAVLTARDDPAAGYDDALVARAAAVVLGALA